MAFLSGGRFDSAHVASLRVGARYPAGMELKYRIRSLRYRTAERLLLATMRSAPGWLKDRITLHRMGELTATKPSLANVEVPAVTIQQLLAAMDE